jgi:hypothetical protein
VIPSGVVVASGSGKLSFVNTEAKKSFSSSACIISSVTGVPVQSLSGPTVDLVVVFERKYE